MAKIVEVGLRIDENGKLGFFGLDEVNERIKTGKKVSSLEEGRALMKKSGETEDTVKVKFEGFSIAVVIEEE